MNGTRTRLLMIGLYNDMGYREPLKLSKASIDRLANFAFSAAKSIFEISGKDAYKCGRVTVLPRDVINAQKILCIDKMIAKSVPEMLNVTMKSDKVGKSSSKGSSRTKPRVDEHRSLESLIAKVELRRASDDANCVRVAALAFQEVRQLLADMLLMIMQVAVKLTRDGRKKTLLEGAVDEAINIVRQDIRVRKCNRV